MNFFVNLFLFIVKLYITSLSFFIKTAKIINNTALATNEVRHCEARSNPEKQTENRLNNWIASHSFAMTQSVRGLSAMTTSDNVNAMTAGDNNNGVSPTNVVRHCEARSNPEKRSKNRLNNWIASHSFAMTPSVRGLSAMTASGNNNGVSPTNAVRHCEERSNPEKRSKNSLNIWIS
jgi:hypothetical protein